MGNVPDKSVFSWPNLLIAELVVFVLVVAVILTVSLAFNAPLEEPVNVMHPPNPAKAPWYFLGLQEMVSYSRHGVLQYFGDRQLLARMANAAACSWVRSDRLQGGVASAGPCGRSKMNLRRQSLAVGT